MDTEFVKTGLTSAEAKRRLEKHGPNKLSQRKKFSSLKLLFSQFTSPLIYVLFFALKKGLIDLDTYLLSLEDLVIYLRC